MMKLNILILIFLLSYGQSFLHAMAVHKENAQRLSMRLAEPNNDEKQAGRTDLVTISLDSPKVKKKDVVVDPVSQKMEQRLIDQQQEVRFYTFLLKYKKQARAILHDREKTEDKIIGEYIKGFSLEQIEENKYQYADEVQKKIDAHYVEKYSNLYKTMYAKEYQTQAPEKVVKEYSRLTYFDQKNEGCCVIL